MRLSSSDVEITRLALSILRKVSLGRQDPAKVHLAVT